MELEEYLKALRECPDDQLTDELGIHDNWPILFDADLDSVVGYLSQHSNYKHVEEGKGHRGDVVHVFYFVPGTVELDVFGSIRAIDTTYFGRDEGKKGIETRRQMKDYKTTIMLHPYQEVVVEGIGWRRVVATVVEGIGELAIREKIPICMPSTIGWKYLKTREREYSRIVYHVPVVSASS